MRLKKIEIELQIWGEHKGKYMGKITFEDGSNDSFTFGMSPDVCVRYLTPIATEVISSANELGKKLAESFTRELSPSVDQANEELKDLNKTRYSSFYTNRK